MCEALFTYYCKARFIHTLDHWSFISKVMYHGFTLMCAYQNELTIASCHVNTINAHSADLPTLPEFPGLSRKRDAYPLPRILVKSSRIGAASFVPHPPAPAPQLQPTRARSSRVVWCKGHAVKKSTEARFTA